jgi:hypothetical protein
MVTNIPDIGTESVSNNTPTLYVANSLLRNVAVTEDLP